MSPGHALFVTNISGQIAYFDPTQGLAFFDQPNLLAAFGAGRYSISDVDLVKTF